MSSGKSDITVLGFNDNGMTAGIPRNEQIHMGIFGEVGSGKSIVDTILIDQKLNVVAGLQFRTGLDLSSH